MNSKFKIVILVIVFVLISQLSFAGDNIFEQLAEGSVNNSIVSKLKGRISLIAQSLAWALFIFTTGIATIKRTFKAWKGGEDLNIVEFDEIMRKLSLIVIITTFTLFSDVIIGFTDFMKKSSENLTEKTFTDTSGKYFDILVDYSKFAHYYQVKSMSNCENGGCDGVTGMDIVEAQLDLEHYYANQKKIPRSVDMFDMKPLQISMYNMGQVWSIMLNWMLSSMLLGFGKFISYVMSYAFSIYMGVLLALSPIPFALSIPKQLKNSYVKMLNSLLTVAMAFVVLNVIDAFFLEGFDNLVTSLAEQNASISSGTGNINSLNKRNEVLFVAAPLYFIVMFGLFFSSMSIASKCVGASSDDGGIASKGFGAIASVMTLAVGGAMMAKGLGSASKMGNAAKQMGKGAKDLSDKSK
jgi:hypothetical protein